MTSGASGHAMTADYSERTKGAGVVINNAKQLFLQGIEEALVRENGVTKPFTIADFGTADGGTSMGSY